MKNRSKIYLILITFLLLLGLSLGFFPKPIGSESLRVETGLRSRSLPDKSKMNMVAFFTMPSEEEFTLSFALYDDPRTKWEADYMELYDGEGELLLLSWIDRHGIMRMAVDRGLLDEETPELERVLVFVTRGSPL